MRALSISSAALIAANLLPLAGVLLFGWSVGDILILYWLENVVIGVLHIVRLYTAGGNPDGLPLAVAIAGRTVMIVFFVLHYGMFTGIHGIFVVELFADTSEDIATNLFTALAALDWRGGLGIALVGIFASHALSLAVNWFGKREYLGSTIGKQMGGVYARVVVLHLVIILGGFAIQALGEPIAALVLLVVLKTGIDLAAHRREHTRLEKSGGEPSIPGNVNTSGLNTLPPNNRERP